MRNLTPSSMRAAANTPGGTSRCACRSLPGQCQPSPTYRRVGLPHSRFRGLLSVHSRCSPHGRWIALGDPFHRSASNDVVTSIIRSDCYPLERQFAGRVSHPLRDGAFPRHTVRNQVVLCRQDGYLVIPWP